MYAPRMRSNSSRDASHSRWIAILDPLEFLLPWALYEDIKSVLTFLQDALGSATHTHALPRFGSLTNYDYAEFGQLVRIDDVGSRTGPGISRCRHSKTLLLDLLLRLFQFLQELFRSFAAPGCPNGFGCCC
jgi:hypothetical protein